MATFDRIASKCTSVPSSQPKFSSASTVGITASTPDDNRVLSTNAHAVQPKKPSPNKSSTTTVPAQTHTHSAIKQISSWQMAKNPKRQREETSTLSSEGKKQSRLEAFSFGAKRSGESENSTTETAAIGVARAEANMLANPSVASIPRSESPSSTVDSSRLREVIQRTTVSNLFGLPPGLDDVEMDEGRSSVSRDSATDSRPNSTPAPSPINADASNTLPSTTTITTTVKEVAVKIEMASQLPQTQPPNNNLAEPQSSVTIPTAVNLLCKFRRACSLMHQFAFCCLRVYFVCFSSLSQSMKTACQSRKEKHRLKFGESNKIYQCRWKS